MWTRMAPLSLAHMSDETYPIWNYGAAVSIFSALRCGAR